MLSGGAVGSTAGQCLAHASPGWRQVCGTARRRLPFALPFALPLALLLGPRGDASGLTLNSSILSPICLKTPSFVVPGTRPSQSEKRAARSPPRGKANEGWVVWVAGATLLCCRACRGKLFFFR